MLLTSLATLGGIGRIPFAPGTFGSAAGVALYLLLKPPLALHLFLTLFLLAIGILASSAAEHSLGEQDSGKIVIDEFVGVQVALFALPPTVGHSLMAFLFFRIFDILKPLFIRNLEQKLKGGMGVMADDILAGIYANLLIHGGIWISGRY